VREPGDEPVAGERVLTNQAVRALRGRFSEALAILSAREIEGMFGHHVVALDSAQLQYLVNLLGSHLTWRSYLVPED